jgi:predicted transcriptional regulator
MSNLKTRLAKLEEAQKSKAVYQETPESEEKTQQWLDNTIQRLNESLNDGTHVPEEPWVIRPAPDGEGPIGTHLHNIMNRLAEREQNEQSKKQSG